MHCDNYDCIFFKGIPRIIKMNKIDISIEKHIETLISNQQIFINSDFMIIKSKEYEDQDKYKIQNTNFFNTIPYQFISNFYKQTNNLKNIWNNKSQIKDMIIKYSDLCTLNNINFIVSTDHY